MVLQEIEDVITAWNSSRTLPQGLNLSASALLAGGTDAADANATGFFGASAEEIEHFLGDAAVLHAGLLVLGFVALLFSRRFPHALGAVTAISIGLWVALIVQEKQPFADAAIAGVEIPKGQWVPLVAGGLAAAASGIAAYFMWRLALGVATYGVLTMLFLALCRLFDTSPEAILQLGGKAMSAHPMVGAVGLVVLVFSAAFLARRFHKAMVSFVSAHIGMLLLLSGLSYFVQQASGEDAPFSLLQDLARIWAQVRHGRCKLFDDLSESNNLQGCDCGEHCKTEIAAWILSSWTVILVRFLNRRCEERRKLRKKLGPSKEEKQALHSPDPDVVGSPARC
mmetsp:Transcript_69255/g.166070  ORF Transcript_69255/g.166070 Transcript_69255/m.166070 type:complete len:339 (+) Transcript_69255:124-1140(+)